MLTSYMDDRCSRGATRWHRLLGAAKLESLAAARSSPWIEERGRKGAVRYNGWLLVFWPPTAATQTSSYGPRRCFCGVCRSCSLHRRNNSKGAPGRYCRGAFKDRIERADWKPAGRANDFTRICCREHVDRYSKTSLVFEPSRVTGTFCKRSNVKFTKPRIKGPRGTRCFGYSFIM